MIDVSNQPLDIEEIRRWLIDHKAQQGWAWGKVAEAVDVPTGTISQFGSPKGYAGDENKIAEKVARYRQFYDDQQQITHEVPEVPGYFESETSGELTGLLRYGHSGEIVVAAMGPGTSKTTTANQYAACYPNTFVITMSPATKKPVTMMQETLAVLGETGATGSPYKLASRIKTRLRTMSKPLFIYDEAQHMMVETIEEVRIGHDTLGLVLAFLGNIGVLQRMEGGGRNDAFAQIFSRVSMRMIRDVPLLGDVDKLADAWKVYDEEAIEALRKIVMIPGGMRNGTKALKLAALLAGKGDKISAGNLANAWSQLSARRIGA